MTDPDDRPTLELMAEIPVMELARLRGLDVRVADLTAEVQALRVQVEALTAEQKRGGAEVVLGGRLATITVVVRGGDG